MKKPNNRKEAKQKLVNGEKVEVRSTEEGFSGSWHSATIIASRGSSRHVKYDHLLVDDGSKQLMEWIKVTSIQKGQDIINYRSLIRTFPPSIEICKCGLSYGVCVDALFNEAWWEGVIFDHEDGSLERLVFFPDLGDQHIVKIDELRITQDWNEVEESWKPRRNWVFLELIDEYEQERPVVVSIRQIWYELRAKEGFRNRIKEWTCSVKSIWSDLVSETIGENLELFAEQVINAILSKNVVNLADRPIKKTGSKTKKRPIPIKAKVLALSGCEVVSRGQEEGTQFAFPLLVDPVGNFSSRNEAGPTVLKRRRRKASDSIHVVLDNQVKECTDILSKKDIGYPDDKNLINSDSCNLPTEVVKCLLRNTNGSCDDEVATMQIQDFSALPSNLNLSAFVSSNSNCDKDDAEEARGVIVDIDQGHEGENDRNDSSHTLSQEKTHLLSRQNGEANTTSHCRKLKKKKGSGFQLDVNYPTRVLHSSKRARQVVVQSPGHHTPRTVLSWLIESNVVLPSAKVRYLRKKNGQPLAEGRITHYGIKCNCCQKNFTLASFEAHAGSKLRQPSASIFLEDGRSLLDCQQQVVQDTKLGCLAINQCKRIKSNHVHKKNDYICSVCHYGGTLVLCDQCPSSFHLSCLGLEDLPDGKWFCPSCRCGICGQSEFHGEFEQSTANTVLCCDQCNRKYHVGCIKKRGSVKKKGYQERNWFCSYKCKKIHEGLHNLLGKSVPAGVDNLSLTILKTTNDVYHRFGASEIETMTEHQSKLNVALGLLHECFEPIKEPRTRRDLIKDVLSNNMSELNRLNFRGFYTVLLEREDELISVATVRVHGEKVAEVPLVGTCVQYRRQGMCRILFDVLEKNLRELGVERLLLPAVPQVLHSWTTSFGFSKMTNSERLEFLEYTFLDFQDTTMCQKILRTIPAKCTKPRGNPPKHVNGLSQSKENIHMNRHRRICKVIQAEEEHGQIVEQEKPPVYVAVDTANPLDLVTILDDSEQNRQNSEQGTIGKGLLGSSDEKQREERGLYVKYYKRKRIGRPVRPAKQQEELVGNGENSEPGTIGKGLLGSSDEKQQERGLHVKYYKRRRIRSPVRPVITFHSASVLSTINEGG